MAGSVFNKAKPNERKLSNRIPATTAVPTILWRSRCRRRRRRRRRRTLAQAIRPRPLTPLPPLSRQLPLPSGGAHSGPLRSRSPASSPPSPTSTAASSEAADAYALFSRFPSTPSAAHYARNTGEMPIVRAILEDIVQHTLSNLHGIQKSLLYWQSRAKGTNSQKMYFMIFERGPRAFAEATCQKLTRLRNNRSPSLYLLNSASDMISTKLADLTSMRHCLAAFLAEVYSEVNKCREGLTESSDKSPHILVAVLNTIFSKLEVSLRNADAGQTLLSIHDGNSSEFLFERLPEVDVESSQWTEALSTDSTSSKPPEAR